MKEERAEVEPSQPQAILAPVRVVRDEAAVFQAAQALFPPSFHTEGINKAKDALADMEDLVANWGCDTSDDLTELDEEDSCDDAVLPEIVVTECPTVNNKKLDLNFGKDAKDIRGPFNSACFALVVCNFLQAPKGDGPIPRAEADWDFTCIQRCAMIAKSGDALVRHSGGLFLPWGKSGSFMPLTIVTAKRNNEGSQDSEFVPFVDVDEYENATADDSASDADSDELLTPVLDIDVDLFDCPIAVTQSPTLQFSELDLNVGKEKIPGLFDPLHFALSTVEFLEAPKGIVPTPRADPDWDFTCMAIRRGNASNRSWKCL